MGKTRKRLVRGTYGIRTGFTEQECSRRRTTPISCAQVQDLASGGISSFPGEVTSESKEVAMPVWAWILIIVLLVLLLTGGVYVRR